MPVETENLEKSKEKLEKAAFILKSLAHPLRLAIIQLLEINDSLSVNDLCVFLNCEQSLVSHHLINMKLRGVLKSRKDGLNIYYSIKEREVLNVMACIEKCNI